jgi:DNA-directed RNA polymerase subunit RPC12/RpoP
MNLTDAPAFLVELVCSLCGRPVTTVPVGSPHTRIVLLRPLRCQHCGGVAMQGETIRLRKPEPRVFADDPPRRGRRPRWMARHGEEQEPQP